MPTNTRLGRALSLSSPDRLSPALSPSDGAGGVDDAWDRTVEDWLKTTVANTYDAYRADPSQTLNPEQVIARLAAVRDR